MEKKNKQTRALGLCSGGLDSMLAGLVLREQGIDVTWVTFETPFFNAAKARKASDLTGIPLLVRPIFNVYMKMLKGSTRRIRQNHESLHGLSCPDV